MDTRKWDEVVEAIEAYRACPQNEQFDSVCCALADCTLYVPVGDFDGNNAVISPLRSVQGGTFLPLYADKANVRPAQHSEGVRPADWQHILSQLSHVEGCVLEPYSVNFAFDRRFVDVLVKKCGGGCDVEKDSALDSVVLDASTGDDDVNDASALQEESSESDTPVVHAWPGLDGDGLRIPVQESDPSLAQKPAPVELSVPASIPSSLNEAMQAVSNECGVPVWLFEMQGVGEEQGYLMVVDASSQWFDEVGVQAVNGVLGRFPDPGARLDFVARESELGRRVEGQAPHYLPRVSAVHEKQNLPGQAHGLFRRLFKR